MRVVVDTNVLISALFWAGKPKQLLNKARLKKMVLLTSRSLLDELRAVLTRKNRPFKLSVAETDRVIIAIREIVETIEVHSHVNACKERGDNRVLACAIDGGADYIVSGDRHLLEIEEFKGIRIVTVSNLLGILLKETLEKTPMRP